MRNWGVITEEEEKVKSKKFPRYFFLLAWIFESIGPVALALSVAGAAAATAGAVPLAALAFVAKFGAL